MCRGMEQFRPCLESYYRTARLVRKINDAEDMFVKVSILVNVSIA